MASESSPAPEIELRDVTVHFGTRPILDRVSASIEAGSSVAVIGPNGVGKTTLLKVLAGVLSAQEGNVLIRGVERRSTPEAELQIRQWTTFIPDDLWTPKVVSGREYLMAVGALYGLPYRRVLEHTERLIQLFQLNEVADKPLTDCSTGQKKKFSLCAGLVTDAPLLLFDEPFSGGLDPAGIMAFREILRSFAETRSHTVVFTTPVPELVEVTADRILVISDSHIVLDESVAELKKQHAGQPFGEVLQNLVFPNAASQVRSYLSPDNS
ncbi:MAG: ABC transporter ATP-binding protein [Planctomycetaceae bacterium]